MADDEGIYVKDIVAGIKDIEAIKDVVARRKDFATLDEKLTAEIRRQTVYLLTALALQGSPHQAEHTVKLTKDYENLCDEADRVMPRRQP